MRLLCVGDIHLGRLPSRLPAVLLDETSARELGPAAAWRRAVDYAIEAQVDAVLLAGDVVEQEDDFYEAFGDLRRGVDKLAKAGVPILAVSGNHDVQVLPRLADVVPGFRLLGRGGCWEIADLEGSGGRCVHVLGWSFPERRVSASPLATHELPALESRSGPLVGLLHCDRDASGSPYAPVRSAELASAPADAWLLGHIHKPDTLHPPRPIGYLGSLTGLDPGEAGRRGPWLLDCSGPELAIEHLPFAPLRWEEVEVAVDGLKVAEDVHGLVIASLDALHERLVREHFQPRAVGCRLRLTGRGWRAREIEHVLVADSPRCLLHSRDGVVYFVHEWRMEVTPAADLDDLARGTDPPALLARKIICLRGPDSAQRQTLVDGARRRLEAHRRGSRLRALATAEPLSDEVLAGLLERAALAALDELLAQRGGSA